MNDLREKVIKGLECCILHDPDDKQRCSECPYEGDCVNRLKQDSISLLKAQEPIAPKLIKAYPHDIYECRNCGHRSVGSKDYKAKYCPECGRPVKWDVRP